MSDQTSKFNELRQQNPEVASIMDVYAEIERIYQDAVKAMGCSSRQVESVQSSADVNISFSSFFNP